MQTNPAVEQNKNPWNQFGRKGKGLWRKKASDIYVVNAVTRYLYRDVFLPSLPIFFPSLPPLFHQPQSGPSCPPNRFEERF